MNDKRSSEEQTIRKAAIIRQWHKDAAKDRKNERHENKRQLKQLTGAKTQ